MSVLSELLATVKRRLAVHALATALTSNLLYMLVWWNVASVCAVYIASLDSWYLGSQWQVPFLIVIKMKEITQVYDEATLSEVTIHLFIYLFFWLDLMIVSTGAQKKHFSTRCWQFGPYQVGFVGVMKPGVIFLYIEFISPSLILIFTVSSFSLIFLTLAYVLVVLAMGYLKLLFPSSRFLSLGWGNSSLSLSLSLFNHSHSEGGRVKKKTPRSPSFWMVGLSVGAPSVMDLWAPQPYQKVLKIHS